MKKIGFSVSFICPWEISLGQEAQNESGVGGHCIEMGFTLMFLANLLTHGLLNLTKYNLKICYRMNSSFASGVAFCVKGNVRINIISTHSKKGGGGHFGLAWTTSVCRMIHYYRK